MLTDEQFSFVADGCDGMELDAVWDYFLKPNGSKYLQHRHSSFGDRREAFLWTLRRLLEERRIELVDIKTHVRMIGTIDEQVDHFRWAFPKDDSEMNNGVWFLTDACPGGSAWRPRLEQFPGRIPSPPLF